MGASRGLGLVKASCAGVNNDLGLLGRDRARAIITAALEIARGEHDRLFPVDVFQTASGTTSNMNANEVIATNAQVTAACTKTSSSPLP